MTRLLIIGKNNEIPRAAFTVAEAYQSMKLRSALDGFQNLPNLSTSSHGAGSIPSTARRHPEVQHG